MDLDGAFLDSERALLHSLPESEGAMAPLASRFLRPCLDIMLCFRILSYILHLVLRFLCLVLCIFMSCVVFYISCCVLHLWATVCM